MAFPPEIVEKILINCDGKTLLTARAVCQQWNELVEYLSRVSFVFILLKPNNKALIIIIFNFFCFRKLLYGIGVVAKKYLGRN